MQWFSIFANYDGDMLAEELHGNLSSNTHGELNSQIESLQLKVIFDID